MNVDNMRAVANLIELEDRFYYASWTEGVDHDHTLDGSAISPAAHLDRCGTTGCVAGWAAHLALREGFVSDAEYLDDFAAEYLGLDEAQAQRLFFGHQCRAVGGDWTQVTAVEIAKFMRSVADGEVEL